MNMRKITSLTALVSFVLMMLTSIILYIVPAGRVAYWSEWKLWSLTKEQWAEVHINLGFLFFISIVLHIYYNWTPIVAYLKNRARQVRVFTPDFNVALVVTLVVFFGTLAGIPPMSSVIKLSNAISERGNLLYGEPPYGHAELSPLQVFAERVDVDLEEGLALLRAAGIEVVSLEQTVKEVAEANDITPQQLFLVMKPPVAVDASGIETAMPSEAPSGTGKRTLAQICEMYQLNPAEIVQGLNQIGIKAELDMQMKNIAEANGVDPQAIYAEIYRLQEK